jgi:hypothetical protein
MENEKTQKQKTRLMSQIDKQGEEIKEKNSDLIKLLNSNQTFGESKYTIEFILNRNLFADSCFFKID